MAHLKSSFQRQHLADRNDAIRNETTCYRESENKVNQLQCKLRDERQEMIAAASRFNNMELPCISQDKKIAAYVSEMVQQEKDSQQQKLEAEGIFKSIRAQHSEASNLEQTTLDRVEKQKNDALDELRAEKRISAKNLGDKTLTGVQLESAKEALKQEQDHSNKLRLALAQTRRRTKLS